MTKLSKNEDVRAAMRVSDDVVRDPRTGFVVAQAPQAIAIPGTSMSKSAHFGKLI